MPTQGLDGACAILPPRSPGPLAQPGRGCFVALSLSSPPPLACLSLSGSRLPVPRRLSFTVSPPLPFASTRAHAQHHTRPRDGRWLWNEKAIQGQRQWSAVCRAGQGFLPQNGPQRGKSSSSSNKGNAANRSRQIQLDSTKLLHIFLDAEDLRAAVLEHVDILQEDFFVVASTYMEMAKKEEEDAVVAQLEAVLRVAMEEKERTLRPEIRLLNQLLRDKSPSERLTTMASYSEYIVPEGYFFSLLNRMTLDVEASRKPQEKLLSQLKMIKREAAEQAKAGARH